MRHPLDRTPEAIVASEAAGQRELVNSTKLPLKLHSPREEFEKLGFVFGDPVDDLFQEVTLPEGWVREGSSHSLHTYVSDEKGFHRVSVFYKAAFYDREAFMGIIGPGYQKTGAQADTIEKLYVDGRVGGERWITGKSGRNGDFYVFDELECELNADGRKKWSANAIDPVHGERGSWVLTGKVHAIIIAADGTIAAEGTGDGPLADAMLAMLGVVDSWGVPTPEVP